VSKNVFDLQINKCINNSGNRVSLSGKNFQFFRGNSSNIEEFLISSIVLCAKFPECLNELSRGNFSSSICFKIFEIIRKMNLEGKYISFNSVFNAILDSEVKNEFIRISNSKYTDNVSLDDINRATSILLTNSKFKELKSSSDLSAGSVLCFLDELKKKKK